MKNLKYILLLLFFIIYPTTTKAAICSNSKKVELQNMAKNISNVYEYVEGSNSSFNLIISNMNSNLYLKEINLNQNYFYNGGDIIIYNLEGGKQYKFNIYSNTDECTSSVIYTIYANLPYYNPYYNDSLCSGIENYKFCKKFVNMQLDYDTFQKSVLAYKESLNKKNDSNEDIIKNKWLNSLLELYINTYYIVLPFIIIVCLVIRHQYNKKNDLF